jgi:predicted dithiol-disulfide oxidoreductase (DUF899 family)
MAENKVVSREEWAKYRADLLKKEKEFTKAHDKLAAEIRDLPWVKIEKNYVFHTTVGDKTLAELFEGKSQLFVYHFMLGPSWKAGCPSCSMWADSFDGLRYHLPHRDVAFKVVSRASLEKIQAYRKRMGWEFDWVSAADTDFNLDLGASANTPDPRTGRTEESCISVFIREGDDVYQTYFTTGRGAEAISPIYGALDLTPKGRDESTLPYPMAWIHRHDEY